MGLKPSKSPRTDQVRFDEILRHGVEVVLGHVVGGPVSVGVSFVAAALVANLWVAVAVAALVLLACLYVWVYVKARRRVEHPEDRQSILGNDLQKLPGLTLRTHSTVDPTPRCPILSEPLSPSGNVARTLEEQASVRLGFLQELCEINAAGDVFAFCALLRSEIAAKRTSDADIRVELWVPTSDRCGLSLLASNGWRREVGKRVCPVPGVHDPHRSSIAGWSFISRKSVHTPNGTQSPMYCKFADRAEAACGPSVDVACAPVDQATERHPRAVLTIAAARANEFTPDDLKLLDCAAKLLLGCHAVPRAPETTGQTG